MRFRRSITVVSLVALALAASAATASAAAVKPPANIASAGKIVFCADISFPPFESYASGNKAVGADVDLGTAFATLMGVKAVWRNTGFDGIIPALQAKQCDAIMSGLYDKASRRKVVDFVDYAKIGNSIAVPKGNPHHVAKLADLSGHEGRGRVRHDAAAAARRGEQEAVRRGEEADDDRELPEGLRRVPAADRRQRRRLLHGHLDRGVLQQEDQWPHGDRGAARSAPSRSASRPASPMRGCTRRSSRRWRRCARTASTPRSSSGGASRPRRSTAERRDRGEPASGMTTLASIQFDSHYFWDHLLHPQAFFLRAVWTTVYVAVLGQAFGTSSGSRSPWPGARTAACSCGSPGSTRGSGAGHRCSSSS